VIFDYQLAFFLFRETEIPSVMEELASLLFFASVDLTLQGFVPLSGGLAEFSEGEQVFVERF